MHSRRWAVLVGFTLAASSFSAVASDCVPLQDGLESPATVAAAGGSVLGSVAFLPAVDGSGAAFDGNGQVIYSAAFFSSTQSTVSLWIQKRSADASGGILQVGALGQPNTLGVFYVNGSELLVEMRNSAGDLAQHSLGSVLSDTGWVHFTVAWHAKATHTDVLLFLNGRYAAYLYSPGSFAPTAGALEVGRTGYYEYGEVLVDELTFADWRMRDGEIYGQYVLSSNRHRRQATGKPVSTGPVQLIDGALHVDGRPFRVKGVGYAVTRVGQWPWTDTSYSDPQTLARDLPLLRGMNANTIRTWSEVPDDGMLLDACYNGGVDPIYVIMGFWVPTHLDLADPVVAAGIEADFRVYVNRFKHHPVVLGWGIGNEVNLAYAGDVRDWFVLANVLAAAAYEEEGAAYHPTIVTNASMWDSGNVDLASDDLSLGAVDMWGHNTYFGDDPHCYFDYYRRMTAKPLVFTEYGIDAWDNVAGGEYESVHAQYVVQQWRQIKANCQGATLMAFSDEWWKAEDPTSHDFGGYVTAMHPDGYSNEEWWGLFAVTDNGSGPDVLRARQAYAALGAEYAEVVGDYDNDGDTDLLDLARFQACFGDPATGACKNGFEFVVDGVIDNQDTGALVECLNGPGRTPACPP